MRLSGKVALVTGAGRGIGRAIALRFAQEGARVVVNDLVLSAAESVVERIKEARGQALAIGVDVSQEEEVAGMFERAGGKFGGVDILVNNAGQRRDAPFHQMSAEEWDAVIAVHLKGSFNCAREAQKYMVPANYGEILNIASPIPAVPGGGGQANYAAANAGLVGFTKALAIELGRYNINVNCLAPDYIDTEMTRASARRAGMYLDDFTKAAIAQIPLRRLGTVEDVACVALFLVSDEASFITGQVIYVTGGA